MKFTFYIALFSLLGIVILNAAPIPVSLRQSDDGKWTLLRNGQPYFIKGAGGRQLSVPGTPFIRWAHDAGANSLRTWLVWQLEERDESGKNILDHADELGMSVCVGMIITQVRHNFPYDGTLNEQVLEQREKVLSFVRKYKNHPSVLIWGLGNEIEILTNPDNPDMWREINELARLIKEEDPHHPVMTVTAGISREKVEAIKKYYPEIQILGVNSYKEASDIPQTLEDSDWDKPWLLTEFGPWGPWECPKTSWGAAIEPTSEEKVEMYRQAYETCVVSKHSGNLGSYVFNWGFKQEGTSTWFGMFLDRTKERQATVDLMNYLWSGHWPGNRCPVITSWEVPCYDKSLCPDQDIPISVNAEDPDGDPLSINWWVMEEVKKPSVGGAPEQVPPTLPEAIVFSQTTAKIHLRTPLKEGNYRLFVKVSDGQGGISTRNTPFQVKRE